MIPRQSRVKASLELRLKAGFSAGLFKAALKLAFLQLCRKASFSTANTQVPIPPAFAKLLRSFESCAKAVEKLGYFRKGKRGGNAVGSPLDTMGSPRTPSDGVHFEYAQNKCRHSAITRCSNKSTVGSP